MPSLRIVLLGLTLASLAGCPEDEIPVESPPDRSGESRAGWTVELVNPETGEVVNSVVAPSNLPPLPSPLPADPLERTRIIIGHQLLLDWRTLDVDAPLASLIDDFHSNPGSLTVFELTMALEEQSTDLGYTDISDEALRAAAGAPSMDDFLSYATVRKLSVLVERARR